MRSSRPAALARASVRPDGGDLRAAVGAAGHAQLVQRMRVEPLDGLDADDALVLGLVGEHGRTGDVADGVDAGDRRCGRAPSATISPFSSLTPSASSPSPSTLPTTPTAEIMRSAAMLSRLPSAQLDGRRDAALAAFHLGDLGAGENSNALLLERLARQRRDLRVLGGQDLRQQLDHRHLDAERAIERGELDADGAGPGDQQRARQRRRQHGLEIGPDAFAVRLDAREDARPRAGGDDDMRGRVAAGALGAPSAARDCCRPLACGSSDVDRAAAAQRGRAPDDVDAVLLEEETDAGVELARHLARALQHDLEIERRRAWHDDAEARRFADLVEDLGRAQQRLGRDAAPVETDAAEVRLLDDGRAHAELRRANGRHVAARPAADDDDVVVGRAHVLGFPAATAKAPDQRDAEACRMRSS